MVKKIDRSKLVRIWPVILGIVVLPFLIAGGIRLAKPPADELSLPENLEVNDPLRSQPAIVGFGYGGGGDSSAIAPGGPKAAGTGKGGTFYDESPAFRLLSRFQRAPDPSFLHQNLPNLVNAINRAEVVERVHHMTFYSGSPYLDKRDEAYLVAAIQNNAAVQRYRKHPFARIIVLGYASKDGSPRNNFYALSRARRAAQLFEKHSKSFGFEGPIFSLCGGETTALGEESGQSSPLLNRAAEIWLVVSPDPVFSRMKSDDFL